MVAGVSVTTQYNYLHGGTDVGRVDSSIVVLVEDTKDGEHLVLVRRRPPTRRHQLHEVLETQLRLAARVCACATSRQRCTM